VGKAPRGPGTSYWISFLLIRCQQTMHGLCTPGPFHTGSVSRIHKTPLSSPAITKSAMDGSSDDPSTTSGPQPNTLGPELLIRGGDTQGRPPLGGPAAFPSEGGSGRSLSDSGGYGKRGVRKRGGQAGRCWSGPGYPNSASPQPPPAVFDPGESASVYFRRGRQPGGGGAEVEADFRQWVEGELEATGSP